MDGPGGVLFEGGKIRVRVPPVVTAEIRLIGRSIYYQLACLGESNLLDCVDGIHDESVLIMKDDDGR